MKFFEETFTTAILAIVVLVLVVVVVLCVRNDLQYWKKRGIPYIEPGYLFGNVKEVFLLQKSILEVYNSIYERFEGRPYGGFFQAWSPFLMIRDSELVKRILTKDFTFFQGRGIRYNASSDPLVHHIFSMSGSEWRAIRSKVTGAFSPARIRAMFFLMEESAKRIVDSLSNRAECECLIELKDIFSRFTTDVIGACALGIECNSIDNPASEFRTITNKCLIISNQTVLKYFCSYTFPSLFKLLRLKFIDKDVSKFFTWLVKEMKEHRSKTDQRRNDFLNVLLETRQKDVNGEIDGATTNDEEMEITDSLMTAQVLVLFLVGFEMTSSALSFCVLELAANPEIQNKCRLEIDRVMKKHDGKLCYEAVQEMRYLDMVLQEALRLYPPLGYFTRECTEPYPIPDSNVVLERGTTVVICPYAMHRDPTYFPDPLKFDPQRFSEDNIHQLPSVYLPFGEGPRACIGMRFALVEMKVCLAAFLSKYEFSKCLKTQMPPRLEPRKIVTEVADGLWVRIRRRAWINCD